MLHIGDDSISGVLLTNIGVLRLFAFEGVVAGAY